MARKPTGAEWARDMPRRLVLAADAAIEAVEELQVCSREEKARVAVAMVLRELTRADCPKTITALDLRFWANDVDNLPATSAPSEGDHHA